MPMPDPPPPRAAMAENKSGAPLPNARKVTPYQGQGRFRKHKNHKTKHKDLSF